MNIQIHKSLFLLLTIIMAACTGHQESTGDSNLRLWYKQPAVEWTEALPVGNGRLGAMIFGNPATERIQLNEESLWSGSQMDNNNPEAKKNLRQIQQLILNNKLDEAFKLADKTFIGTPPEVRSHQTLGDLFIDYAGHDTTGYMRELDLNTGIARTTYTSNGAKVTQEVFASAPDNIIVVRINTSKKGSINTTIRLERGQDASTAASGDNKLLMTGQVKDADSPTKGPGGDHMRFASELCAINKGGKITANGNMLKVENADELVLLLTAATDYRLTRLNFDRSIDPSAVCKDILAKAITKDYPALLASHQKEYSGFFNRVSIDLGNNPQQTKLPTNVRLDAVKQGADDPQLMALYFQYGRYLMMGSSRRPGVLPANLQGLWNKDFNAPWGADYHTNINLQMNYWPVEVCNLSETAIPLIDFMEQLQKPGAVTAREMYGARGWTLHHLTDVFGRTGVMDGIWGAYPMGGPWMTFTIYDHYTFTGDKTFLKEKAYPIMKSSAQFVMDFLIKDKKGQWVTAPSNSPENAFVDPVSGKTHSITYAATMDIQIITELFNNCIAATRVLQTDAAFADSLSAILKNLPPVKVSAKFGTIQEWIEDYDEVEPGHRHMSHMLGLHPGTQITKKTPELFEAARKTIERRLSKGGGHTGWSRAWIINFYARLFDGDQAHHHMVELLRKSTLPNMFDDHSPFQIDGNFGGTAGIAEMLLQSHDGSIYLLPALPAAWSTGKVKGLRARGGFELDIAWNNGKLTSVEVRSLKGNPFTLAYQGQEIQQNSEQDKSYRFDGQLKIKP